MSCTGIAEPFLAGSEDGIRKWTGRAPEEGGCILVHVISTLDNEDLCDGVPINMTPFDCNGDGDGDTPFSRYYEKCTILKAQAPEFWCGCEFLSWTVVNTSNPFTTPDRILQVQIDVPTLLIAVYDCDHDEITQGLCCYPTNDSDQFGIRWSWGNKASYSAGGPATCVGQTMGTPPAWGGSTGHLGILCCEAMDTHSNRANPLDNHGNQVMIGDPTICCAASGPDDLCFCQGWRYHHSNGGLCPPTGCEPGELDQAIAERSIYGIAGCVCDGGTCHPFGSPPDLCTGSINAGEGGCCCFDSFPNVPCCGHTPTWPVVNSGPVAACSLTWTVGHILGEPENIIYFKVFGSAHVSLYAGCSPQGCHSRLMAGDYGGFVHPATPVTIFLGPHEIGSGPVPWSTADVLAAMLSVRSGTVFGGSLPGWDISNIAPVTYSMPIHGTVEPLFP